MARQVDLTPFGVSLLLAMVGLLYLVSRVVSEMDVGMALLIGLGIALAVVVFIEEKLAIYLLIFSMLLSPEFGLTGATTTGGSLGRGVTFRLDDFLLIILGIVWLIKSALYKELGILKKTPLNTAMVLYIGACATSTLMGIAEGRVGPMTGPLFVLKYTQYFILFFVIINNVDDVKQLRRYWTAVVLTAIIVGTVGLAQIPSGARVTAPFEGAEAEPNTFSGYLAFLILICVSMGLVLPRHRQRALYFLVAGYLFVPFLFTLSRAGYMGIIPGLAVVFFLSRNHLLSYVLTALALSLLLFPSIFPEIVRERVAYTWTQTPSPGQAIVLGQRLDTSTTARLDSFRRVLQDVPEKPWFGYGVTGWGFIDSQYFRTLIETGILGVAALFFLFFKLFQLGLDRMHYFTQDSFFRGLSIGFLGGLVCLLFHAVGSNTFIIVRIMLPFWLIASFVFVSPSIASRFSEETTKAATVTE